VTDTTEAATAPGDPGATRAEALAPTASGPVASRGVTALEALAKNPTKWAFLGTIGVMLALALAYVFNELNSVILSIFIAGFLTLGIDPAVRWFQRRGLSRTWAILIVILVLLALFAGILGIVIPILVEQTAHLVQTVPGQVQNLIASGYFEDLDQRTNGLVTTLVQWVQTTIADPNLWANVGGGALQVGTSIFNGLSTGMFVFILTLSFVATLDSVKRAGYSLVAASKRPKFIEYAERIMASVGSYVSGMVTLAVINAVFSAILLAAVGVKYWFVLATIIIFVTLIPLVGTIITTVLMTVVALFESPVAAIIVLVAMLVYMQVEAYILTPRVMSKAVKVPGSMVLISALAGGTLLGLLGALVAIPVSAAIILLIREIVIPRRAVE